MVGFWKMLKSAEPTKFANGLTAREMGADSKVRASALLNGRLWEDLVLEWGD